MPQIFKNNFLESKAPFEKELFHNFEPFLHKKICFICSYIIVGVFIFLLKQMFSYKQERKIKTIQLYVACTGDHSDLSIDTLLIVRTKYASPTA